ncbi:hypothetical protein HZH68_007858 [Vespula germanica]|uniref:Uncharacterized protein n=1 Tax=Vespula germanica TaxID=30212 RepID=A0A834K4Z1_VESGE|nr:hypothetical protein HZH68_007858 [Vespula germanica]
MLRHCGIDPQTTTAESAAKPLPRVLVPYSDGKHDDGSNDEFQPIDGPQSSWQNSTFLCDASWLREPFLKAFIINGLKYPKGRKARWTTNTNQRLLQKPSPITFAKVNDQPYETYRRIANTAAVVGELALLSSLSVTSEYALTS